VLPDGVVEPWGSESDGTVKSNHGGSVKLFESSWNSTVWSGGKLRSLRAIDASLAVAMRWLIDVTIKSGQVGGKVLDLYGCPCSYDERAVIAGAEYRQSQCGLDSNDSNDSF
jgi:hypothetical protein